MGHGANAMNALVTGGGGFLGSRIARALKRRGDEVTVLGRRDYPALRELGIRTVQADVCDAASVERACSGANVVFHTAALPAIWGRKRDFERTNIGGTRAVIEACCRARVRRLVHTSTPSVVFGKDEICGGDESLPYPARYLAEYPRTKAIAEQLVLAANGDRLATVALRPHLIWGPGDPHLIPRVVARARAGSLIQVGDGSNRVDITYIDNAVDGHVAAADALESNPACRGRAYFLSQGEPVPLWPWLIDLLSRVGAPGPKRVIGYRTAYRLGAALETLWGLLRLPGEPRMTRFLASQLAKSHYFNISAARRDIGFSPRVSTAEGVERLVGWLNGGA